MQINFGLKAMVSFPNRDHGLDPDKSYYVEAIKMVPLTDFEELLRTVEKVYGQHFVRSFSPVPAPSPDNCLWENIDSYYLQIRVADVDSTRTFDLQIPYDAINSIVIHDPGIVCSFGINDFICFDESKQSLSEYPGKKHHYGTPLRVVALSAGREIVFEESEMDLAIVWKAVLITDRNTYLSCLSGTSIIRLEQWVPVIRVFRSLVSEFAKPYVPDLSGKERFDGISQIIG